MLRSLTKEECVNHISALDRGIAAIINRQRLYLNRHMYWNWLVYAFMKLCLRWERSDMVRLQKEAYGSGICSKARN